LIQPLGAGDQALLSAGDDTQKSMRAYVVGGDVTSQQALDRQVESNATI